MSDIKIDIKRTGFPVKIGSLDLWFNSSLENLRNFLNVDEIAREKMKKAEEEAKHIHFPEDMTDIEPEDLEEGTIDAAFSVYNEFIAAQYDIIFGDGTFKKVYKEYPDVVALENALEPISIAIAEKIEEQEEERVKHVEDRKNEYLNKQKQKQKS